MQSVIQHSALYTGTVRHRRFQPRAHEFEYKLFMLYLDLDEVDSLFPDSLWWSTKRPAVARFRRRDYFGDPDVPLAEAVRDEVVRQGGKRPEGPIRMLTHGRYYGYCFNPVTFYYCFDRTGERVETIMAEITNTPWKQRHTYVLTPENDIGLRNHRYRFDKAFHVSPFMPMDQAYDWRFSDPVHRLSAHFENYQQDEKQFDATLVMERRALTLSSLRKAVLGYPFMTLKVIAAIHWQALKLYLKQVPFHAHPGHKSTSNQVSAS